MSGNPASSKDAASPQSDAKTSSIPNITTTQPSDQAREHSQQNATSQHPLPPFPPMAVSPEPGSSSAARREALLNAAAVHVAPESPAPNITQQRDENTKGVSLEGIDPRHLGDQHHHKPGNHLSPEYRSQRIAEEVDKVDETPPKSPNAIRQAIDTVDEEEEDSDSSQEDRDPDQRPLIRGTPLDELKTPMFEKGPSNEGRQSTSRARRDQASARMAQSQGGDRKTQRPGFGAGKEMGSTRMGASALVTALNAVPWEDDSGEDTDSSGDELPAGRSAGGKPAARPKVSRLHSSLHTIRPMNSPRNDETPMQGRTGSYFPQQSVHQGQSGSAHPSLQFPFRQNTIARKARSPGPSELAYQFSSRPAQTVPLEDVPPVIEEDPRTRRASDDSTITTSTFGSNDALPAGPGRDLARQQLQHEGRIAEQEEGEEIVRAAEETPGEIDEAHLAALSLQDSSTTQQDVNTSAALREGESSDEMVENRMETNPQEKKRLRREILAERLQEVFGLEEREEVLEEMRCWLLRSVMLKGYMYLTPRHICFFAKMPSKENLIVKTGPLSKKNSRTKMYTKFWAVLRNDVLSWYDSTADPYFPRGNISLQYASSCDPADETRFKLRTSERSYTFTADTESSRDEWIKSIQKVMFKTQHEGESIKLIIPVDAVYEIEKSPTLEFAETVEIKCVDPDDQMSMDSYFFASFQDSDRAMASIQRVLDERPAAELPRAASPMPIAGTESAQPQGDVPPPKEHETSPTGLKKLGSILKPLVSRDDKNEPGQSADDGKKSSLSIPFITKHKPSHDSLETLRQESSGNDAVAEGEEEAGYPPRQTGEPPKGMGEEKGWQGWMKKPSKIFGSSPSSSSLHGKSPPGDSSSMMGKTPPGGHSGASVTRMGRGKKESVTEVVEPLVNDGSDSEDEHEGRGSRPGPHMSFGSESSVGLGKHSEYSLMERSESNQMEEDETVRKFRSVFSLTEKEKLIDHFPGCLYRVLPVSGRFFVSTNYFCFRSSQLLYKTKMIIPIRDLYGLKAQKAFRPGHSGLIIVIKGHEELFLEFTSADRREACVSLLEERMEDVRIRSHPDAENPLSPEQSSEDVAMRIMEDLDESAPLEARSKEAGTPSMMFGSTTSTFLEFKPDPMRITCLTIGSRGDVQPYIALCKGLQAEGHHTRIASHGEYKDWVEGHGIEFASVGGDPAELMAMCVDNGMFTYSFMKEGLNKFRGWLDDLLSSSWEACQGSDLLIESPSAMGGIHIAEALRIPYYRAFTMPWTRTRAYPHAFAVPEHKKGGGYNYMTYTMFDQVFWRAIAGQVNRFRRKNLGIDSTNFDKLEQHKVPFLYNFSPNVVPPPLDWTEWIHVTGYWFLENADESAKKDKEYSPPDGIVDFIDNAHKAGKKVVYIGFGSIVVSDPEEMTRCVVEAVVDSGVCAILSKGWSDRGSKKGGDKDKDGKDGEGGEDEKDEGEKEEGDEGEKEEKNEKGDTQGADGVKYPDSIFPIDSIDHTWLFPRIDAACHHGGAGSSGASLRAGIPTIIKPFFGDQAFWAERVESLNVGSAVRKLTAEALSEALIRATTDEKQIAKAKIVGEMIRKENGVSKAIEAIYRDLEYAKSIIKPPPEEKGGAGGGLFPALSHDLLGLTKSKSRKDEEKEKEKDRVEGEGEEVSDGSWDVVEDQRQAGAGVGASPGRVEGGDSMPRGRRESDASVQSVESAQSAASALSGKSAKSGKSARSGKEGKKKSKGRFSAGGLLGKVREKIVPGS